MAFRTRHLWEFDLRVRRQAGVRLLAGVDEAGRGALLGPVVAAAVIMSDKEPIEGVDDSKKLSARRRADLFEQITANAHALVVTRVDAWAVDRLNVLEATKKAMAEAVSRLRPDADLVLVDAVQVPGLATRQESLIHGDAKSYSIAAASILAKVTRDRILEDYHRVYPEYGLESNKGYGTELHRKALSRIGPCPEHRYTYRGVVSEPKELLGEVTGDGERQWVRHERPEPTKKGPEVCLCWEKTGP